MNRLSSEEFSMRYAAWIAKNKIEITSLSGMDVQRDQLHPRLREYQKDAVLRALGVELNPEYFKISCDYMREKELLLTSRISLFDLSAIDRKKVERDYFADVAHVEMAVAA